MSNTAEHLESIAVLKQPASRPVTVFLPETTREALGALAANNERSLSAEVRWVLRRYTEYPDALRD